MAQAFFEIRNTIKSSLTPLVSKCNRDAKLEYLIKMTQALVLTNEAIWKHCQCYLDQEKVACYNKKELPFKSFGFNKVIVETTDPPASTRCIFDFRTFSMMPLPKELSNVILPHEKEGIVLMNYREYLQNAFLLEETILIPFLAITKDHLEKLQVDLEFIETWIMGKT